MRLWWIIAWFILALSSGSTVCFPSSRVNCLFRTLAPLRPKLLSFDSVFFDF